MKIQKYIGLLLLLAPALLFAQDTPDFAGMMTQLDRRSNFEETDYSCTMTMIIEKADEETTKRVVNMFRDDAEDKFLMLTVEPDNQKGQGMLRVGDNMWRYDPESRQFIHTSLKEVFEDTDARNNDFRRSTYADDYEVASWEEGTLGSYQVWIVKWEAKNDEVPYPYVTAYIDRASELLLMKKEYSLSGRLLRTTYQTKYAKVWDKYIPTQMIMKDETVEGNKTSILISQISTNELDDSIFSKSYLERVNR